MSLLSRLLRTLATDSIADPSGYLLDYYGGGASKTGVKVNAASALRVVAVYACMRIGAETIGSLPLHVYERLADGGKRKAPEHPLYSLLHDSPNAEMTSLEWREAQQGHVEGRGNGYAQILFGNDGRPAEIIPLSSDRVSPRRRGATGQGIDAAAGELVYEYRRPNGSTRIFPAAQILHVRCFGSNGIEGFSPIAQAREAIGLALASEEHWARFFGQGSSSKIALQHPKLLSSQAHKNLQASWAEQQTGLGNAHKPIIAEEGMTVVNLPINFGDLQFLETRKFQITEIARLFRIPPHLIGDTEGQTTWGTGIEQMNLAFVIYSMLPRLVRWEQRLNRQLFLSADKGRYFCEFALDGLMRGDKKSRAEALQIERRNGIISGNDWADIENYNHFEGGDIRIVETNMTRLERVGEPQPGATPGAAPRSSADTLQALKPVLASALGRSLRRESKGLTSLAKKSAADRTPALAQFYEEHRTHLIEQLSPIMMSLARLRHGREASGSEVERVANLIVADHRRLAEEAATAGTLEALAGQWEADRAEQLSNRTIEALTT